MAYQVLARKYRPQRFADVAGQGHVTVTLMNALIQQRIAHGYIFSGHRGIGKTTIARILAMALNCRNSISSELRPTAEPCEVCDSCIEIRAGNAVDVIEIDAATNRGIDEIRELRDAARYRPARDRYKIYILDEAHQITDAAFNALLKTLEEPPDHIVFMMATTQPEDIPQTVRSRCQHFNFHAVKMTDILNELRDIAAHENVEADDGALSLLAEAGDGSMRDALSVMDQAIASAPTEAGRAVLSTAQIRELMGTVSNALFERLLEAVNASRSAEVMTLVNELMDAGNSPSQLARQMVRYLRNVLLAKIAGLTAESAGEDTTATGILQISPDERRRAARTASLFTEEEITRYLQVMLRTFDELSYRQEPRFHFELGLMKLVHLRRLLPMEDFLSQLPAANKKRDGSGAVARPPTGATESAERAVVSSLRSATSSAVESSSVKPVDEGVSRRSVFSPFAQDTHRKRLDSSSLAAPEAPAKQQQPASTRTSPPTIETSDIALTPEPVVSDFAKRSPAPSLLASPSLDLAAAAEDGTFGTDETPSGKNQFTVTSMALPEPQSAAVEKVQDHIKHGDDETPALASESHRLRQAVLDALHTSGKQSSAAEALEEAEWLLTDGSLRVQTTFSKTMLSMILNPEADRIARSAIREAGGAALKIEWLSGAVAGKKPAAKRTARSGSAQAKAEEHPIVKQAQELFQAEIRKVIDLSGSR